jgi:hypothetical protein
VDWIHLAEDRDQCTTFVNTVMKFRVPYKVGNFLTSWATVGFSRRSLLHGVSQFVISLSVCLSSVSLLRNSCRQLCILSVKSVFVHLSCVSDKGKL